MHLIYNKYPLDRSPTVTCFLEVALRLIPPWGSLELPEINVPGLVECMSNCDGRLLHNARVSSSSWGFGDASVPYAAADTAAGYAGPMVPLLEG